MNSLIVSIIFFSLIACHSIDENEAGEPLLKGEITCYFNEQTVKTYKFYSLVRDSYEQTRWRIIDRDYSNRILPVCRCEILYY